MSQPESQIAFGNADVATLATGAGVTLVGAMAGRGLQVLGQIVLARLLGPATFGLYAIGWTILRTVGLVAPLGLDKGIVRYGSCYWHTDAGRLRSVLFQSLGLAFLSGLLLGGSLYLAAPWLAEQVFKKPDLVSVLRCFSAALPLAAGLRVASAATTVSQRTHYVVYTEFITQSAASLVLLLVFYLMGYGLLGAVAADVASFGIALVLAVYYMRCLFPEVFSRQVKSTLVARELLAFSIPASFAGGFTVLILWADRLLVGYFRTAAEVGIYQTASQSSMIFVIIVASFGTIFSPMIADLYHKREMGRVDELLKVSTKWALYLSLPFFLIMCFAPREFVTVVFSNRYESGALPMAILVIGQLISAGTGPVGPLLVMTGHHKQWLLVSGVALVANIVLNWLLIPRLGLPGAALGTACAVGGLSLVGLLQIKRSLGIWPYDGRYLKGLLAAAIAAAALFLLRMFGIAPPLLSLSLAATISIGVFVVALLLLGLDAEDWELVYLIRARLESSDAF